MTKTDSHEQEIHFGMLYPSTMDNGLELSEHMRIVVKQNREYRDWLKQKVAMDRQQPKASIPRRYARYYCNTVTRGRFDRKPKDYRKS